MHASHSPAPPIPASPTFANLQVHRETDGSLVLRGHTRHKRLGREGWSLGVFLVLGTVLFQNTWILFLLFLVLVSPFFLWSMLQVRDWQWKFDRHARRLSWRRFGVFAIKKGEMPLDELREVTLRGRIDSPYDTIGFDKIFYRVMLVTSRGELELYQDSDQVSLEGAEAIAALVRDWVGLTGPAPGDGLTYTHWLIRQNRLDEAYDYATQHAGLHQHMARGMIDTLSRR